MAWPAFIMAARARGGARDGEVMPVHPTRMPVILEPADYKTWLTGAPDEAAALLRPFPVHRMHVAKSGVGVLSDDGTHAD